MGRPEIKSKREIELMRTAGKIVGEGLDLVEDHVEPGITTKELDERFRREFGLQTLALDTIMERK